MPHRVQFPNLCGMSPSPFVLTLILWVQGPTTCLVLLQLLPPFLCHYNDVVAKRIWSHHSPYIKLVYGFRFLLGKKSKSLTWLASSAGIPTLFALSHTRRLAMPLFCPHTAFPNASECECARAGSVTHLPHLLMNSSFFSDCSVLRTSLEKPALIFLLHNTSHNVACLGNNTLKLFFTCVIFFD